MLGSYKSSIVTPFRPQFAYLQTGIMVTRVPKILEGGSGLRDWWRGESRRFTEGLGRWPEGEKTLKTTSWEMLKAKSQWGGTVSPLGPRMSVRAWGRLWRRGIWLRKWMGSGCLGRLCSSNHLIIKVSLQQEDRTVINIYTPNDHRNIWRKNWQNWREK